MIVGVVRSGRVISDDRSPVPAGTICFVEGSFVARGDLSTDGTFVVGSLTANDGLPPGTYNVYFMDVHKELGYDGGGMPIVEALIDAKYSSPDTSGLTVNVDRSTRNVEFEVDRATKGR